MKKIGILNRVSQKADTPEEESAIDEMVYELYGLSEEEVRIVEGKG